LKQEQDRRQHWLLQQLQQMLLAAALQQLQPQQARAAAAPAAHSQSGCLGVGVVPQRMQARHALGSGCWRRLLRLTFRLCSKHWQRHQLQEAKGMRVQRQPAMTSSLSKALTGWSSLSTRFKWRRKQNLQFLKMHGAAAAVAAKQRSAQLASSSSSSSSRPFRVGRSCLMRRTAVRKGLHLHAAAATWALWMGATCHHLMVAMAAMAVLGEQGQLLRLLLPLPRLPLGSLH
jgi:hypothetical protein